MLSVKVGKKVTYSIGHRLESFEHCSRMHGHNYTIELWARADLTPLESNVVRVWEDALPPDHMTLDFGQMKQHIEQVAGFCDQWNLNDAYSENNPTAEWAALRWLRQLCELDSRYFKLILHESENSVVEVEV